VEVPICIGFSMENHRGSKGRRGKSTRQNVSVGYSIMISSAREEGSVVGTRQTGQLSSSTQLFSGKVFD